MRLFPVTIVFSVAIIASEAGKEEGHRSLRNAGADGGYYRYAVDDAAADVSLDDKIKYARYSRRLSSSSIKSTKAPSSSTKAPKKKKSSGRPPSKLTPEPSPNPTPEPSPGPTPGPTPFPTPNPAPASVRERLEPFALMGGDEWDDPETCRSKALERVEEQEGADNFTDAKLVQYYALYCIYNCTNGVPNPITDSRGLTEIPGWSIETGWTATDLDPCVWFGIGCENDQVTVIALFQNFLTGSWPAEVKLLAADGEFSTGAGALVDIDLFNNPFLFNNFDNSWMSDLGSSMEILCFGTTAFAGDLVPLPVNLVEFDCSFTSINGGLVNSTFAGLDQLDFALLDGNAYNTSVPAILGSLENLRFLYIANAFVSGDLSYLNGEFPSLVEHWIDGNQITGNIPTGVGNLPSLASFSVTKCFLTGQLPTEIANLPLIQLWFYANQLSGQIPSEYGQISNLGLLQLEGNDFTGSMPDEICANVGFPLFTLGADCDDPGFTCACCTCCSLMECAA